MSVFRATAARGAVAAAIAPHFPPKGRWQLVEHEGTLDDGDRVRVRITVREIAVGGVGASSVHKVTTHVTFTIPTDSLIDAEAQLDDEMDLFLFALDKTDVPWTTATKGKFPDEGDRLGYSLDIETFTKPTEENE